MPGADALGRITLALGGARSGKSRFAEELALSSGLRLVYLATAQAKDAEMARRIEIHRKRRGEGWTLEEEPLELAESLVRLDGEDSCVLVDCLTLWVSNLLLAEREAERECDALAEAAKSIRSRVIFVSNEVGSGIVPDNALARRFRDLAGSVNQKIASISDRVYLISAGLPLVLKRENGVSHARG